MFLVFSSSEFLVFFSLSLYKMGRILNATYWWRFFVFICVACLSIDIWTIRTDMRGMCVRRHAVIVCLLKSRHFGNQLDKLITKQAISVVWLLSSDRLRLRILLLYICMFMFWMYVMFDWFSVTRLSFLRLSIYVYSIDCYGCREIFIVPNRFQICSHYIFSMRFFSVFQTINWIIKLVSFLGCCFCCNFSLIFYFILLVFLFGTHKIRLFVACIITFEIFC